MSRFISAGAIDATTGEPSSTTSTTPPTSTTSTSSTKKSQEWEQVQAQLAAARAGRAASEKRGGGGEPERSLYDVLQANKAAKQAAFEEASRLRNQFRALDDDEIEFLEGVRRRQREEEERVRRETEEGLRVFRDGGDRYRSKGGSEGGEGDGEEGEGDGDGGEEVVSWELLGRRRKTKKRKGLHNENDGGEEGRKKVRVGGLGVKKRVDQEEEEEEEEKKKKGDGDGDGGEDGKGRVVVEEGKAVEKAEGSKVTKADGKDKVEQPAVVAGGTMKKLGGLVAYGSSDEDDDY